MQKIRYRLVYNRKHTLNKQGTALIQVEAKLNQRNIYLTTNVYLRPDHWNKDTSEVVNHPQSVELNAMLFEYVIYLQGIELSFWKRGIQPTLALLRDAVQKKSPVNITFTEFSRKAILSADKTRIKKHFTFHTARHTCATLLIHQGVAITTVQKLLGHTSVKTTEIYSEVLSSTIVKDLSAVRKKKNVNNFSNKMEQ